MVWESWPRHGSCRSGAAAANNDPAPVTGIFTNPAQASSAVSKPAGCLERSRHIPMPALRA
jgi:hypothetical protein